MSAKTWKEEFYPITAAEASVEYADNPIKLTEHSLKKWQGLHPENLEKHGVSKYSKLLFDIGSDNLFLAINDTSCSLCEAYYNHKADLFEHHCSKCPLYKFLGNHKCDEDDQPYVPFSMNNDIRPMISALQGTIEMLEEEKTNEC